MATALTVAVVVHPRESSKKVFHWQGLPIEFSLDPKNRVFIQQPQRENHP
jgi:hypothetical protein